VATLAVMYLRVRCCACPAFLLYNVGTGNFRGRKDTRTPLLAYITTNSMCAGWPNELSQAVLFQSAGG
jgi:Na+-driven multidrug efflux pump